MSGAIPPLPQYAFMAWCLVKAQGQLCLLPLLFSYAAMARSVRPRLRKQGRGEVDSTTEETSPTPYILLS
jgi:hypothetical protein